MLSLASIGERIKAIPPRQRVLLAVAITLSLTAIILFAVWMSRPDYQLLFSNLTPEDSARIVEKLRQLKIPYKVTPGGIMVPSDRVYDLRIELAGEGLPQGGSIGFEIFDKTNFAMTDFLQRINYQRALQGELSRTIRSLSEVQQCRVHISIPEKSLFSEERPKASVVVKLYPGKRLTKKQIQGIVHLLSSSVEGLAPDDVTVIDSKGNLLTSPKDDSLVALSTNQLEYQSALERRIEEKIINLLEPVIGKNKVKAKVSAEVSMKRIETKEERFDPDSQVVRSEQKKIEKSTKGLPGGVPGIKSNLPSPKGVRTKALQGYTEKKNEIVNYEISKKVSHEVNMPGKIKKLSVVVLVDGIYSKDKGERKFVPRPTEELKKIEDIVKNAVGIDEKRGDTLAVVSVPFENVPLLPPEPEKKTVLPVVFMVIKYALPVLALILVFLFVVRPLMKVVVVPQQRPLPMELPKSISEVEKMMLPERSETEHVLEWARKNPKDAARLVKGWLEEA